MNPAVDRHPLVDSPQELNRSGGAIGAQRGVNSSDKAFRQFRVLLWTKYFGSDDWSHLDLKTLNCNFSNCLLTEDKSQLDSVDAVFFHWRDTSPWDLPQKHIPGQKWIIYNWEPPVNTLEFKGRAIADQIDWVMSYRKDSDIYVPYGSVIPCDNKWQNEDLFDGKTRSVAWIVSNCHSDGNREEYVRELAKFIDVDIYGRCGHYECPRDDSCLKMITKKYKFYLSFENSLCKDYVTEKLFRIAEYDIIPVVYGSANYSQIMPKNSYINTADFGSPQELANHLKEISSDKQKYNSYMNWKNNYCSKMTHYKYFCNVCHKLNVNSKLKTNKHWNKEDLINWFYRDANCLHPTYDLKSCLQYNHCIATDVNPIAINTAPNKARSSGALFPNQCLSPENWQPSAPVGGDLSVSVTTHQVLIQSNPWQEYS
ncbi:unnamed protein product [Oppiella nova]|uniref:Fucosyltransferase n=1 Tax=Oppiella nova TaxID=334625 RepID=A0A7R9MA92_9ACAR|nr:unnamed protein product [Oppiella nova]CAG2173693.1 unnamed protein product [Oppiella nova]